MTAGSRFRHEDLKQNGGEESDRGEDDEGDAESDALEEDAGGQRTDDSADALRGGQDAEQGIELALAVGKVGGKGDDGDAEDARADAVERLEKDNQAGSCASV